MSDTQLYHIHNYTEYNQQWNVFSAFNPSKCTHTWSSGQPTLRHPGSSREFGALLKGLTTVVENSCRSRNSNTQPRVTSPTLDKPRLPPHLSKHMTLSKDPFESRILYQCTIHETSCNTINTLYTCRYRCICKKTLTAQGIMQLFNIFTVQYVLLTASGWNG